MRNQSRSIFHPEDKNHAIRSISDKIVLASKSRSERKIPRRKPVEECYCQCKSPKLKLTKYVTETNSLSCQRRINDPDDADICSTSNTDVTRNSLLTTILGCQTLRQAERIMYLPTTEFLCRVQKNFLCQRRKKPMTICPEISLDKCTRDSTTRFSRCATENTKTQSNSEETKKELESKDSVSKISTRACGIRRNLDNQDIEINQHAEQNRDKLMGDLRLRKIVRSIASASNEKSKKRIVRTIQAQSRCCKRDDRISKDLSEPVRKMDKINSIDQNSAAAGVIRYRCGNFCDKYNSVLRISQNRIFSKNRDSEDRVRELSKFRREHYFETHGSVNSLIGTLSKSSDHISIEDCECDNRSFVTPCPSSKQINCIHYYSCCTMRDRIHTNIDDKPKKPRSSSSDINMGHIVDLGILKIPCLASNNITLNYHRCVN